MCADQWLLTSNSERASQRQMRTGKYLFTKKYCVCATIGPPIDMGPPCTLHRVQRLTARKQELNVWQTANFTTVFRTIPFRRKILWLHSTFFWLSRVVNSSVLSAHRRRYREFFNAFRSVRAHSMLSQSSTRLSFRNQYRDKRFKNDYGIFFFQEFSEPSACAAHSWVRRVSVPVHSLRRSVVETASELFSQRSRQVPHAASRIR